VERGRSGGRGKVAAENEIGGAEDAEAGPEVVELERLAHVVNSEGNEDGEGDDFLEDFELAEGEAAGVADAVGGDLQEVFEEGDAPTDEGGDDPGLGREVFEVGIPGERHEDVGADEEGGGFPEGGIGEGVHGKVVLHMQRHQEGPTDSEEEQQADTSTEEHAQSNAPGGGDN